MQEIITPEICENFRKACHKNQEVIRGLMEQAVIHSRELSDVQNELIEKHMETLFAMASKRTEKTEKGIIDLHKKINKVWTTVLIGCILVLIAVIVPYSDNVKNINNNALLVKTHMDPETHAVPCEEAREEIDEIWDDMDTLHGTLDKCNTHVARAELLIRKYDSFGADIKTLERKMSAMELSGARLFHKH